MECKSVKSMVLYILLHLTSHVFESFESETLPDVDKDSNSFLFEEIGKFKEYIH